MDSRQKRLEMLYAARGLKYVPEKEETPKPKPKPIKKETPVAKKAKEPAKTPAVTPKEKE